MASRAGQKIKLTSIDELLCVPETEGTVDIDVRAIYPFENHPFRVVDDEKMEELVESIKANGILTPVLVRPDDEGTYEMISGHRRLHAAKKAGLLKIPAIVKEMTNDDAVIAMVDANVQREEILPSEKAFAYRMKLEAIKRQGARNDLTSPLNGGKLKENEEITSTQKGRKLEAADIVGKSMGVSGTQIQRYIRLTELIPKLLDMVDEKRLALSVAVELSYMNKNVQQWIYEFIRENGMIKQEQLMELRKYRDDENMTQEKLINILIGSVSTVPVSKKITLNERKLHKFFPAYYSKAEMERVIFGLLEQWKQAQDSEEK
jgi:ParB family chromosome partitioning protein